MRLIRDGNNLTGTYFYTKVGNSLNLKGTVDAAGHVVLQESDAGGKQTGVFKGTWADSEIEAAKTIEGKWSKPGSASETDFYLVEQPVSFRGPLKFVSKEIKEENKKRHYSFYAEYPQLQGLQDAGVESFNREVAGWAQKSVNDFKKGAGHDAGDENYTPGAGDDTLDINYTVRLATDDLISIEFSVYDYENGAAHGNSSTETVNFDLKSGKKLKLSDLFNPGAKYLDALSAYCIKDLKKQARKENPNDPSLPDENIEGGAAPDADNYHSWNITGKGLLITFDPYQVGPYAAGTQQVVVPYTALREIVRPDGPIASFVK